jgi:hypothetical protein
MLQAAVRRQRGRRGVLVAVAACAALVAGTLPGPTMPAGAVGAPAPAPPAQTGPARVSQLGTDVSPTPLAARVAVGAWVPGSTTDPTRFDAFERTVGAPMDIVSLFYGFGDVFPAERERALRAGGRRSILIAWDMGSIRFSEWASGRHDAYLAEIGRRAAAFGAPVHVRPWAEMNGDWQPYMPDRRGTRPAGGTYREFRAAWRHVVRTVRAAGGTSIQWVFNPYAATYRGTADVRRLWPGRRFVDVLGLDGYNWGGGPQGPWRSFERTFAPMYRILTRLDRRLPVWICEVASREPSIDDGAPVLPDRSKGEWIASAFTSRAFPRLRAVVWFDEDKERDWRVDSSPEALAAFRAALAERGIRRSIGWQAGLSSHQ